MLTRIVSSIVCLPIFILFVIFGGLPLKLGILVISLIGMYEFYHAFSLEKKIISYIGYFIAVIYGLFIESIIDHQYYFSALISLFIIILLIYSVLNHKKAKPVEGIIVFFGFFYVCFMMSHVYLIREYAYGYLFIWLIFISAWGCDTGAYFTGVTMGKHKLIPDLSPKKTIEGSIGGILTAFIISLLYGYFIQRFVQVDNNILLLCGIIGIFGSILSQFGDLIASAIKRYTGIKDFGHLIPGHGGILDRFDSVLLTAPLVYYVVLIIMQGYKI